MTSAQSLFNDPPPYSDTSSWASDFDSPEDNDIPPAKVSGAPEPTQATQAMTELKQGPETEKMKEFLTFVMFRDYAGLWCEGGYYTLRDSTRDHFLRLAEQIEYVNRPAHVTSDPETSKRCAKDSNDVDDEWYFWRNIYEPCRILNLPHQAIVDTIMRFYEHRRSFYPRYWGCIAQVVSEEGMQSLARKIAFDREVIFECLFGIGFGFKPSAIKDGLKRVEKQYFVTLDVRDAQNYTFMWRKYRPISFEEDFKITYQLGASGVEAENNRPPKTR